MEARCNTVGDLLRAGDAYPQLLEKQVSSVPAGGAEFAACDWGMLSGDDWTATLNLAGIAAPLKTCRVEKAGDPENVCRYFADAYVQRFGEDQGSSDTMRAPLGDMVRAGADSQALLQAAARIHKKGGHVREVVTEYCGMDLPLDSDEADKWCRGSQA